MKKYISLILCLVIMLSCINVFGTYLASAEGSTKVLSEEFAGYTRVLLSDFKTTAGNSLAISAAPAGTAVSNTASSRFYNTVGVEASDSYLLDKTYFDFDINLAESTNAPSIMLYEKADWNDYLRLRFNNTAGTLTFDYISAYTGSIITRFNKSFSLIDYGRTSATEFFNIKIRADFNENSTDSTKRDATFQLWINNRFATEETLTGEDMRNGLFIRPGGETIYLREQKYLADELAGYKRVDMLDFSKSLDENGIVSLAPSDHAIPNITDFDKTYLDVDLNYGGETGRGAAAFQYLAYAKWANSLYLGFNGTTKFILSKYDHVRTLTDLATLTTSDFGISPSEYFNVKLRTDIEIISSSEYSITAQLWLNNKYACQVTANFVYGPDAEVPSGKTNRTTDQTGVGIDIRTVSKTVSVKSNLNPDSQLFGYKRITAENFENINGTKSEIGRDFSYARGGEYQGGGIELLKSYFDVDIKAPNGANPFMAWLSKNKTKTEMDFYGDGEQLRFYFSGTTLKLMKVHGGNNAGTETFADISVSPYNYSADMFFNFKVKTDIYEDSLIGIAVWVNNTFVKKIFINTYDAETIANMTCAGFRGTSDNPIYVRTPSIAEDFDISLPVFDAEQHINTVNYSGTITNGAFENFDYCIEDLLAPVFTQYNVAASEISNNSSVIFALAETDYVAGGENCFFGLRLTPQSGWDISLFDKNIVSQYDYLLAQNYPDTTTNEASSAYYTVTVKTANGSLSLWINGILAVGNYRNTDYNIVAPKAVVYADTAPITADVNMWCEIDNYNLLGDINGDLTVDICDLVRMKKVASNVDNATAINDYVKAFNDNGSIGNKEISLLIKYLVDSVNTLASERITLIAPRNGTVTARASSAVNTLETDYDHTKYTAEQFRILHKDQYYRDSTILKWKNPEDTDGYTVFVGTDATLTGAVTYNSSKSNLRLDNLLPNTTYYWQVVSSKFESGVFSFVTADTVRTLTVKGISNTRDIGGYDAGDNFRIKYGMVFRGGKVDGLSEDSKSVLLNDLGVNTDLDLRGNGGTSPLGNTVNYYSYSAPYYWNSTRGINAGGDYQTALVNSIRVFADPSNYPIYMHCSLGRDRTGTLALLISGLCGVSKSDLFFDYELSFLSEVGSTGDSLTTEVMVGTNFATMYDQIQTYAPSGSFADACEAFMLSIGVTQSEIDSIRANLKESKTN